MNDVMFFYEGWEPVARILLIGTAGYATLLALLRVSGQRTLSRMTPFDFVITVTLGSAFGRVLTAQEVALVEVFVAFGLLVVLQWLVVWVRSVVPAAGRVLMAEPALLYHDGRFSQATMRRHRITTSDLRAIAREKGLGSLNEAYAIVLEPDGLFSVITHSQRGDGAALENLASR